MGNALFDRDVSIKITNSPFSPASFHSSLQNIFFPSVIHLKIKMPLDSTHEEFPSLPASEPLMHEQMPYMTSAAPYAVEEVRPPSSPWTGPIVNPVDKVDQTDFEILHCGPSPAHRKPDQFDIACEDDFLYKQPAAIPVEQSPLGLPPLVVKQPAVGKRRPSQLASPSQNHTPLRQMSSLSDPEWQDPRYGVQSEARWEPSFKSYEAVSTQSPLCQEAAASPFSSSQRIASQTSLTTPTSPTSSTSPRAIISNVRAAWSNISTAPSNFRSPSTNSESWARRVPSRRQTSAPVTRNSTSDAASRRKFRSWPGSSTAARASPKRYLHKLLRKEVHDEPVLIGDDPPANAGAQPVDTTVRSYWSDDSSDG